MTFEILAGNTARLSATITALPGHGSLVGTTAKACVTDPTGESTALPPDVDVGADSVTVTVTVDWEIADDTTRGSYTLTIDTTGPLVAAVQSTVFVLARLEPVVPTG